jgi:hypothetical protein
MTVSKNISVFQSGFLLRRDMPTVCLRHRAGMMGRQSSYQLTSKLHPNLRHVNTRRREGGGRRAIA